MAQWFNAAFGPGCDPGYPGSSPMSGSVRGACFSLCLGLCLSLSQINKSLKKLIWVSLGGSVVELLPSAQGMILESRDRVPRRAPCMEPASPSACVSAALSLCVSHE